MSESCTSLSVWRFGLALGMTCALGLLFMGLMSHYCGWGTEMVALMSTVYMGYEAGVIGAFIGALWGLVDGTIGGALIALFYNLLGVGCRRTKE